MKKQFLIVEIHIERVKNKKKMLPVSAIVFLSLLAAVAIILGIINLMFGKACCCCRDDEDQFDSDSSGDEDETKGLLELEEKQSNSGSATSDDVRIKIYGRKCKLGKMRSYPAYTATDVKEGFAGHIDDDGNSFLECDEDSLSSCSTTVNDLLINDKDFEVGPVHNKPFVRAVPNTVTRKTSLPNRPQNLYYGTIDNKQHHHASVFKTKSVDNNKDLITDIFNGVQSISIQVLVTFDEASKTLSSAVKQIELGRKNINNTTTVGSTRKTNTSKLFWQVVIEVLDREKLVILNNQRTKTKYRSVDNVTNKIHFQRNLETDNMDCEHLDNYLVRYSIYARRGTRISHKQLFGQTNVFLTSLKQQNILFEWRAVPSPGTNILEFNNDERLI